MPLNFRLFVLFLLAGVYSLEYLCARYAHNFASSSIQIITHTNTRQDSEFASHAIFLPVVWYFFCAKSKPYSPSNV